MSQSTAVVTRARHPTVANVAVTPNTAAVHTLPLAAQIGLLAGPFLSMVDSNIVNVAIPDIAREPRIPLATAQWVVSGYLLALAAMLAASAFLAKRFGARRVYLASLPSFSCSSRPHSGRRLVAC